MSETKPLDEAAADASNRADAREGRQRSGTSSDRVDAHQENMDMLQRLDAFLDEQAEDHRKAMNEVMRWLQRTGGLEQEIHQSVEALGAIFQKWSFEILFLLRMRGTMRFNQLKEELTSVGQVQGLREKVGRKVADLAGVGSRTLSQRLKDLEGQGLVRREVYPEVPVRVEYSLTRKGVRFGDLIMPVIAHLRIWDARRGREASR